MQIPVLPLGMNHLLAEGASGPEAVQGMAAQYSASDKWKPWVEDIEDPYLRGVTAFLLEAEELYCKSMAAEAQSSIFSEATLTTGIATFTNFALPIVRGIVPNLIASEIVSLQPMTGPTGIVFFMKMIAGSNKGATTKGQELSRNPDAEYSSEQIDSEDIGTGDGAITTFDANLTYIPIRPGTLSVTDTTGTGVDDGDGAITGTGIAAGSTINYNTGQIHLVFSVASGTGDAVLVDYRYDMEGSEQIPEVDVIITSSPVVARPRKLRSRYSLESAHNLRAVHGLDADAEVGSFLISELRFEIDREVITQLETIANGGTVSFNATPSAGLGLDEHLRSYKKTLVDAGGLIFDATKRATGNWVIGGRQTADIIEVLPGFVGSGLTNQHGVANMGTIDGRWTAYRDSYMGAANFLVGHKGSSFMETGYVLAMYVPLYATPAVTLDDFLTRRGMGSLYAKKAVDSRYYVTGTIT